MKKLTKKQMEIESIAEKLRQPGEAFRRWHMRLVEKHNMKDNYAWYESFFSVHGDYVIERTFKVVSNEELYNCTEVAQTWTNTESGVVYFRERSSHLFYGGNYGYRWHGYDATTPFTFKYKSGMRDQYGYQFARPNRKGGSPITKALKRKGATKAEVRRFGVETLSKTLADPRMETMLKHSRKDFNSWLSRYHKMTDAIWSAYKITIRHKYNIRDFEMWYDMVNEMEYLGMDVHNPRFVCPKAYRRMHDDVVGRAIRRRERERRIREAETIRLKNLKNQELVEERMSKFGDLSISNGTIHAVVIITADDYHEEGKAMHHCVGGYFDKPTSLILSMRDNDGKRIETTEISLSSFTILQSRGLCNASTPYHKEIVDLVNSNMWQIEQRMKAQRKVA